MYSGKILSAFGLRVSRTEARTVDSNGIPSSMEQHPGVFLYNLDMKWLTELHVASWRAGNVAYATACDDMFHARIQVTEPVPGDDNAPVVRICSMTAASVNAGTQHTSGWVLMVNCARPLEIAVSADIDMLAVLCARNE